MVDIQWYQPQAQGHAYDPDAKLTLDGYGRLLPAPNRFPSGFKALADYVHGKGLKFGIHVMRGIPRQAVAQNLPIKGTKLRARDIAEPDNPCRWNPDMWGIDTTRPGSQAYYDSIVELYASWGVDFIKADDMGSHLYQPAEMKALHRAILRSGRPIVLSISPGPAPVQEAEFFQKHSQMWRISDDFWDEWRLLRQQFEYARDWAPEIGKGNTWPDADMLAIGRLRLASNGGKGEASKFTPDEQRTMMTLWSIMRSPLIMGGDLPQCDAFTLSLLTNPEVIAVDQHSRNNRPSPDEGGLHGVDGRGARRQGPVPRRLQPRRKRRDPRGGLEGAGTSRRALGPARPLAPGGPGRGHRAAGRAGAPRERSLPAVRALIGPSPPHEPGSAGGPGTGARHMLPGCSTRSGVGP